MGGPNTIPLRRTVNPILSLKILTLITGSAWTGLAGGFETFVARRQHRSPGLIELYRLYQFRMPPAGTPDATILVNIGPPAKASIPGGSMALRQIRPLRTKLTRLWGSMRWRFSLPSGSEPYLVVPVFITP